VRHRLDLRAALFIRDQVASSHNVTMQGGSRTKFSHPLEEVESVATWHESPLVTQRPMALVSTSANPKAKEMRYMRLKTTDAQGSTMRNVYIDLDASRVVDAEGEGIDPDVATGPAGALP